MRYIHYKPEKKSLNITYQMRVMFTYSPKTLKHTQEAHTDVEI